MQHDLFQLLKRLTLVLYVLCNNKPTPFNNFKSVGKHIFTHYEVIFNRIHQTQKYIGDENVKYDMYDDIICNECGLFDLCRSSLKLRFIFL